MGFKPKGEVAQWVPLFEHLEELLRSNHREDVITWDDWIRDTGIDVRTCRSALKRACDELMKKHSRTVESVRGVGYRIDVNRIGMARQHQRKGMTQFETAEVLATQYDPSAYTPAQVDELERFGHNQMLLNAMVARQLKRQDQRIGEVEERQERLEERVDARISGLAASLVEAGVIPKELDVVTGELADDDEPDD